jgi:hypothetical protein
MTGSRFELSNDSHSDMRPINQTGLATSPDNPTRVRDASEDNQSG